MSTITLVNQLRLLLLPLALMAGCSCSDVSLGDDDGGLLDGGRRGPRPDECGNGLDDDRNGLIDDDCPCAPGETQSCFSGALASSSVGACSGGTQTCEAIPGSEWGDWGASGCEGEVLPATETCDGLDVDCDGAIDEGCPCSGGTMRSCGDEFVMAPCMAGVQTCRSGSWSSCEGAIGPTADVCGDDVDNDCDGVTDDMCECPYPASPERCSDGVDNDCDGTIDEPECTPMRDAGVPLDGGPDAGESCTGACLTPPPAPVDWGGSLPTASGSEVMEVVSDGAHLFALRGTATAGISLSGHLPDGTLLFDTPLTTEREFASLRGLVYTGSRLLAAWDAGPGGPGTRIAVVTTEGVVDTILTRDVYSFIGGGPSGVGRVWARDGAYDLVFQRLAPDGTSTGPVVPIGAGLEPTSLAVLGDTYFVGTVASPSATSSQVHLIRGDAVVRTIALRPTPVATDRPESSGAVLASSCGHVMACWREHAGVDASFEWRSIDQCQLFDIDGASLADPVLIFDGPMFGNHRRAQNLEVIATDGSFLVRAEGTLVTVADRPRSQEWFIALDEAGAIQWTSRSVGRDRIVGGYGESALVDGCVHTITTDVSPWWLERTCFTTCE